MSDEPDTRPDLTLPCPACADEHGVPQGFVMETEERGTGFSAVARRCPVCRGEKQATREEVAKFRSNRRQ